MSIIKMLPQIIEESEKEYKQIKDNGFCDVQFFCSTRDSEVPKNIMGYGDNLSFMKHLAQNENLLGGVQLIYIDPPFFSKAKYAADTKIFDKDGKKHSIKQLAYKDTWDSGLYEYLKMLCTRFYMMKDLLCEEGVLWVHLDWHVVHYAKILLDEIFGEQNFVNEVIWNYKSGGSSKRHYSKKHDTLLFYAKSDKYYFEPQKEKSYNRGFKPYRFKGVEEFCDDIGWYTMVNMKDVWQIDMVGRTSGERTGYATQKPEALLSRIIRSCTREGDIVADFFGGSGSLCAVAQKMGRRWIYCDAGKLAFANAQKRILKTKMQGLSPNVNTATCLGFRVKEQKNAIIQGEIDKKSIKRKIGEDEFDKNEEASAKIEARMLKRENFEGISEDVLQIGISSYKLLNMDSLPLEAKDFRALEKILAGEHLPLIDYWYIDFDYDGEVFRPTEFFIRENDVLALETEKAIASSGEDRVVAIKIFDIFGNVTFVTKNLK